jgi:hypothetical protein
MGLGKDGKWHQIVAEVETHLPFELAPGKGTNAKLLANGDIFMPWEMKGRKLYGQVLEEGLPVGGSASPQLKPKGRPNSGNLMEAITDVKSGGARPQPDIPGIQVNDKGEAILSVGGKERIAYKRGEDGVWTKPDGGNVNKTYQMQLEKMFREKADEAIESMLK